MIRCICDNCLRYRPLTREAAFLEGWWNLYRENHFSNPLEDGSKIRDSYFELTK